MQKRTNRELLMKGLKNLVLTLFLFVTTPLILHLAFLSEDKPLFIPLLGLGLIMFVFSIVLFIKTLQTILKALS